MLGYILDIWNPLMNFGSSTTENWYNILFKHIEICKQNTELFNKTKQAKKMAQNTKSVTCIHLANSCNKIRNTRQNLQKTIRNKNKNIRITEYKAFNFGIQYKH